MITKLQPACVAKRCNISAQCARHTSNGPNPDYIGPLKDLHITGGAWRCIKFVRGGS